MMMYWYPGMGLYGWFFMVIWWAFILVAIIALIRWISSQGNGENGTERNPLDILKERYARGEIDKKEFEQKKRDLTS